MKGPPPAERPVRIAHTERPPDRAGSGIRVERHLNFTCVDAETLPQRLERALFGRPHQRHGQVAGGKPGAVDQRPLRWREEVPGQGRIANLDQLEVTTSSRAWTGHEAGSHARAVADRDVDEIRHAVYQRLWRAIPRCPQFDRD